MGLSDNNQWIATGSTDQSLCTIDFDSMEILATFVNLHDGPIRSLAISADSDFIVTGSDDRSIRVIDVEDNQVIMVITDVHDSIALFRY